MRHSHAVSKNLPYSMLLGALLCIAFSTIADARDKSLREPVPGDDFVIREEMIPMRDGVKLYTIIMVPKNSDGHLPIMMTRTPYDAGGILAGPASTKLGVNVGTRFLGNDYIYVSQDIRGRFKSEGDYVMFRHPIGPLNDSDTDHTTDTWDTIEWLINNVDSNGRVGVWGTSYPGWLTLAALKDPHPALAAAVPFNPVVDVWKADDWFHWGAFRGAFAFGFIYSMQSRTDEFTRYPYEKFDFYQLMMEYGALGSALNDQLDERHEMWTRIVENPAYGPEWQAIAADQWFDSPSRLVPTLHVHGFWDQEDIYGSPAVYAALEKHDRKNDTNFFVAGPWYHGQHFATGDHLGDIDFDESTSVRFREDVLKPFLRRYLHGEDAPAIAPVTVFETGVNRWREFEKWPPAGDTVRLYLQADGKLSFDRPKGEESATHYVSDPANPVPYAPRPNLAVNYDVDVTVDAWRTWLVTDQRFADHRPDVVNWISEPLQEPLTIRGGLTAHVFAETTGTDADWVVKLIDVFPDPAPGLVQSGYQFMVSGDIFRGRYREDYENPQPIEPDVVLEYTIPLPHANHTIAKGHRLMVQIQSTWFPLYDRNPQTYVESIMFAPEEAYQAQTHSIHHDRKNATYIEFRVDASQ
ncbi:MAG: CocE/NonD family hydrolase [Proteobacteria bacterium]|nr:CocE/NonD family hydrolase [Pseudomonadota bacterium]